MKREVLITIVNFGIFVELLSAIFGSIYFYKYKGTFLKFFCVLLWYSVINDICGVLIREYVSNYNAIIYNIYHVLNFTYLILLYHHYLNNKNYKRITLILCLTYFLIFIINGFFENYIYEFQRFPYIFAAFSLLVIIVFYFIEILNSERVLNTKGNLLFWISVGLLLYFMGNLPFRILRNYYLHLTDATVYFLVNFTLTIVMNVCFIIGFIWSNKKQQY